MENLEARVHLADALDMIRFEPAGDQDRMCCHDSKVVPEQLARNPHVSCSSARFPFDGITAVVAKVSRGTRWLFSVHGETTAPA